MGGSLLTAPLTSKTDTLVAGRLPVLRSPVRSGAGSGQHLSETVEELLARRRREERSRAEWQGRWSERLAVRPDSLEAVKTAFGELIEQGNGQPDWFVTTTYTLFPGHRRGELTPDQQAQDRVGEWAAVQRFAQFYRELRHRLGHRVEFARVSELHRDRGAVHHHSVIYGCRDLDGIEPCRVELQDWCWRHIGKATIERYDPEQGAGAYLAKYVTKGAGAEFVLDFSRNWGRTRLCS